eukprot:TRINITY_DN304_c0_g1_i1.p1 TRINITY_DN304_c0_g1~~TRINITY_DN304_c0_g1_i1.p1  ORF type:complete len:470 (+),score=122.35 TRINITY_DN304_c0_g1_i1:183-1412(+)
MPKPLAEESSFSILFPRYRERYIRDIWPLVKKRTKEGGRKIKLKSMSSGSDDDQPKRQKRNYEKEKPWDTDDIDHWKIDEFKPGDMPKPLAEESSFSILFPRYRERYIRDIWPLVKKELKKKGIDCDLDLVEGAMKVKTTRKTWDPYAIIKARDFIKLLSRSVPVQQAVNIMQDAMMMDIIKIGNRVRNKERFIKRRQRLIGPNGNTLKAIELLTDCYIVVQGNTVTAMGSHKGLKTVRRITVDCMNNVHPIYNIKRLMIKRQLEKNEDMKDENWDRFLPKYKPQNVQRKSKKIIKKKNRKLFAPAQTPRKEDLLMETGEYWQSEKQKKYEKRKKVRERQQEKAIERRDRIDAQFIAPEEEVRSKRKSDKDLDIDDAVSKLKNSKKKRKRDDSNVDDYVINSNKKRKHK